MYVKLYGAYVSGIDGQLIEVEVDISNGLPHFEIVGLPGSALKESKERIRSAIKNSGYQFPNKRITVNLAPAHIRKEGSYFDLVIALAILIADQQIHLGENQLKQLQQSILVGELALDGATRRSHGIFPLVLCAKEHHFSSIYLPEEHYAEAKAIDGIMTIPISHLQQLVDIITQQTFFDPRSTSQEITHHSNSTFHHLEKEEQEKNIYYEDFEDIIGQIHVKRAFEIAAAGSHHILMVGPPGSGKTMLARRFQSLMPPLTNEEAMEVTKIKSVAGYIPHGLIRQRPFRDPHHTITAVGMIGGGNPVRPGEVSMAHQGVLFLDEFLEFSRPVLEALREPLEEKKITITRSQYSYTFPANFLLVVALNPCPCGYYGYENEQHSCHCTASQISRYKQKLSGPIFDRIDLQIEVPQISYGEIQNTTLKKQETSKEMRSRVFQALKFKQKRESSTDGGDNKREFIPNGLMDAKQIRRDCRLTSDAENMLKTAFDKLHFSTRGYHKILKLARTIADFNETKMIDEHAIAEAIQYRSLDRQR